MSVPTARAKLRSALRDARGAVAALSLTAFRSHPSCDPVTTRRAAMAAALAFRCLYRAHPARLCRLVYPLWTTPRRGHRLSPADDELYQRTRISLLQNELPQAVYIDSYNSRGFTINGNRVFGPCALLPQTVVQWNVGSHQDITEESFSLFWMLEPRIEIVVVGTGNKTERLHPQVLQAMRQRGIAVEVQDTPNACATFNFLCHEGRVTGAALIPPSGGTILPSLGQAAE
ncbi:NADH dehydrogenase [ubiquinone] 1 alpha subcomplex assembly factor 3 [Alexandromys fortis]|uniref:NADH dehydrogenase [ubiquinone] 1 alpha subcomplex assembly factor 3 n=1 Tax=Alexandromys fortis TaxID=100897 RepID=UPI002152EAE6|nr:NADH dehydrogenase [ubiquinone] 1 alpha subcomplex assembly factor 3 [Microtus fortis]